MVERLRTHSRIASDLPQEVRREVDRLLIEGSATYEEIKAFLASRGHDISKSAIYRYGRKFLIAYRKLRVVQDQSRALVADAGDDAMLLEEAAAKIFAQKIVEAQLEGAFDVLALPRLLSDFAKLQSSSIMRERLKAQLRKKVSVAAEHAVKVARSGGLTEEKAAEIRKKILGIV